MRLAFRASFGRDLKKIEDLSILRQIRQAIEEMGAATDLRSNANLRKLSGTQDCYRLRIADYRIGLAIENGEIEFVRCLHRRDIYRYFP